MMYPCPACGFEVFDEPPGSYDICPVCGWEDDGVQLRFPAMAGGANKDSLCARQRILLSRLPPDVNSHLGYQRCADWRPLTSAECQEQTDAPRTGVDYFHAASFDKFPYYWRVES
jgi:hypothetical protein